MWYPEARGRASSHPPAGQVHHGVQLVRPGSPEAVRWEPEPEGWGSVQTPPEGAAHAQEQRVAFAKLNKVTSGSFSLDYICSTFLYSI